MRNFDRNNRSGGRTGGGKFNRRDGGRRDFRGDRDGGRPEMFPATCADCGNPCEVPFRPRDGRPVFCNNCFEKNGGREERRPDGGRNFRPDTKDRRMFSATCDECGNPCEVPFRPTDGKPVYCKSCFENKGAHKKQGESAPAKHGPDQFAALHAKLDKILSALAVTKEQPAPVLPKPETKVKPKAKAKKKAK
ncbi:MAG: CxxC-x17-CxxC domain-containing protein [Patescibacteria group bacterium]|jgi:CxxC-x17-CxxC domain-containing protein